MELFHLYKKLALLLPQIWVYLLLFSSHHVFSLENYFISCGSSHNTTTTDGRNFIGDVNQGGQFQLQSPRNETVKDSNQSSDPTYALLYNSARVFTKTATYVFDILQNESATYILRLHFCAFSTSPSLSEARFDVSASGHMLLPGFRATNSTAILKEFFVRVKSDTAGQFHVRFEPNPVSQSLAFVNAIELLYTNVTITESSGYHVTPANRVGAYITSFQIAVLETIYRINVGPYQDSSSYNDNDNNLWRAWVPDDPFLVTKEAAVNNRTQTGIGYNKSPNASSPADAPSLVYQTAKALNLSSNHKNLTWSFNVSQGAEFLVRLHFCDFISLGIGDYVFRLFIYDKFIEIIDPYGVTQDLSIPFYKDYIVESGDYESMNVTLQWVNGSLPVLNGVEIMQVVNGAATDVSDQDDKASSHGPLIAGLVVASLPLVVAVVLAIRLIQLKRRRQEPVEEFEWEMLTPSQFGVSSHNKNSENGGSSHENLHLRLKIPFRHIRRVTRNFDAELIIGEGGFGKVYKGTAKNGKTVAVKRSNPDHGQGLEEFQTEIMVLSKIRHKHLVSLIGYCYERGEMILVYEFMEKGTLRDHLYGSRGIPVSTEGETLSWKQRLEICIGAARGLHYLHTGAEGGIIHRDVKSTNILLDDRFVAKVADFGLSRLGHLEKTHISTAVKGTFGYLDPEYFGCMQLTEKSDVYSFGVVLLEALCARPVIDRSLPKEQVNLAEWVISCVDQGQLETVIDPSIAAEIAETSLNKFITTAAKCLKESAADRPPMSDILWDLEYTLQLQRAALGDDIPGDSMTDVSINIPVTASPIFGSQSFLSEKDDSRLLYTSTGEVFSQLGSVDDHSGR